MPRDYISKSRVKKRTSYDRFKLFSVLCGIWLVGVIVRIGWLQNDLAWMQRAYKQQSSEIKLATPRREILDRNDKVLALSVPVSSWYVRPKQIKESEKTARAISAKLNLPFKEVQKRLEDPRPFVWIKRQAPRTPISGLKSVAGVGEIEESRRYYPYGGSASAIIGKVGIDGGGLSGLEMQYNEKLAAVVQSSDVIRDAVGKKIALIQPTHTEGSEPLKLTIDIDYQNIVEEELLKAVENSSAKRAYGVLVDATSGELLSLAQVPSIDYNLTTPLSAADLKNHLIEAVYEPGSTLKPIIAAGAIESGAVVKNEIVDCNNGHFAVGRHIVNDVHPSSLLSFHDVIVRSSNIGMSKIGMRMGAEGVYNTLKNFGFGDESGTGLDHESGGILRHYTRWAGIDIATHSFGQGVAVTPLQIVRAFSAIINDGLLPTLSIVKGSEQIHRQVVSPNVAADVREMLVDVVEDDHGTGRMAKIPGVIIGGKTGTAQKTAEGVRGYLPGSYIASFVGYSDATLLGLNSKLVLLIVVDEPQNGQIYGGVLAAPPFKRIMHRVLSLMIARETKRENRFNGRLGSSHVVKAGLTL